jgi:hypothetical protein
MNAHDRQRGWLWGIRHAPGNLFGGGLGAITSSLDKALGFKVGPLLALATPFVLNFLRQKATTEKLDQQGVAKLLNDEQAAFVAKGGPTAQIVQNALDAGKQAIETKAKYTGDSWTKLRLAPVAAASLVMDASPSGVVGSVKELSALGEAIAAAKKDATPTSLLGVAFVDKVELKEDEFQKISQDRTALIAVLKEAMGAVTTNSPAEAPGYGKFLVDIATHVAEASKEGGFLGIGGTRVSDAERAAIDQIKSAIGRS